MVAHLFHQVLRHRDVFGRTPRRNTHRESPWSRLLDAKLQAFQNRAHSRRLKRPAQFAPQPVEVKGHGWFLRRRSTCIRKPTNQPDTR